MSLTSLSARCCVGLLLVLTCRLPAWSAPAPDGKIVGTDAYGDLLPVDALSRLGTERLVLADYPQLLAFSPDGTIVAASGRDGTVCLWRTDSAKEVRRFQTPLVHRTAFALVFSPDGKLIAFASSSQLDSPRNQQDQVLYVWDVASGKQVSTLRKISGIATRIAFSPDSKLLAASCIPFGRANHSILLLDPANDKEIARLENPGGSELVAFADEGKTLLSIEHNPKQTKPVIHVWDVAERKEQTQRELNLECAYLDAAFSPDGKILAVATNPANGICLFDPSTGKELRRTKEKAETWRLVFTQNGSLLATSYRDGMIRVFETATGKLQHEFRGHTTNYVHGLAISADGKLLASSVRRQDDAVHLWDLDKEKELHSFTGHRTGALTASFLPDGKTLATVSRGPISSRSVVWADWSLRLWDAASGKEVRAVTTPQDGEIEMTVFSSDGSRLATLRDDGTMRLWDVREGKVLQEWKVAMRHVNEDFTTPDGKKGTKSYTIHPLHAMTFSPDGETLVTVEDQNLLHFWEARTGKQIRKQTIEATFVVGILAFSPDARTLAIMVNPERRPLRLGYTVVFVDTATGQEIRRLPPISGNIWSLAFSGDSKTMAVMLDKSVLIAEVASGEVRVEYPDQTPYSRGLAFSPDGRVLATAGRDGVIRFWHADEAKPVCSLEGKRSAVWNLTFSPDGKMLVSAGEGNTAYVWDAADVLRGKLPEQVKLSAKDLEVIWEDLADTDAAKAFRAQIRLLAGAGDSLPWLSDKARAFPALDLTHLDKCVKDLDANEFDVRHRAVDELVMLGYSNGTAVRKALAKEMPSLEAGLLAKEVLEKLARPSPEYLREVRTLELIEQIGTHAARSVLEKLARDKGVHQDEAKASLARLARRGVGK
jgi:WD40 repeat protein